MAKTAHYQTIAKMNLKMVYVKLFKFMFIYVSKIHVQTLKNGLCPLELSIIVGLERRIMRFQYYIKKEDFIVSKQRKKK